MADNGRGPAAFFLGAAVGALILGLGGRIAMAVVALITGHPANLSLHGTIEALIVGTLVGAVGGLLVVPLKNHLPRLGTLRGLLLGLVLMLVTATASWFTGRLEFGVTGAVWLTLVAALLVFAVYGIALDSIVSRRD